MCFELFTSVKFSSVAQSCPTLRNPMDHSTPGLPVHHQLPEFTKTMYIKSVMPSNHLILCCPLLLLPSIFPSIGVFSNELVFCFRWPKYWSFSFNISPSNEHPGLTSFRMDWLDLLAVQGTLKSLLQHHSSEASNIWCSAFFTVQLSHPYMTTGKTIALTKRTFVGKVMSLLFNILSRLVITFLPRSKRLLISWLQSPSAVILEPQKYFSPHLSDTIHIGDLIKYMAYHKFPAEGSKMSLRKEQVISQAPNILYTNYISILKNVIDPTLNHLYQSSWD